MRWRYIAFEGPIGVGKTSLVNLMVEHLGATKILEDISNPFLESFYREEAEAAFQAQLFFLLMRYRKLTEAKQSDLFSNFTVADFTIQKDRIFAHLNLSDTELQLYEKLHAVLSPQVPSPDLVVYLQGSTEVLAGRVRKRGRPEELNLSIDYLEQVNQAYSHFFYHYQETPLLVINTTEIDFVSEPTHFHDLIEQMGTMEGGTQVYVPRPQA